MIRVLITGSRDWTDKQAIHEALFSYFANQPAPSWQFVLVSGACPTGADKMAEEVAEKLGWTIERHPAQWNVHTDECPDWHRPLARCKMAGFRRNREMVDLGATVCYAFILNGSRGATHTADLAERAGIRVVRYERAGQ